MGETVKKFLTFLGIGDVRDNEEEITSEKKEEFYSPESKPRYTDISTLSSSSSSVGRKGKVVNIHTTTQLKVVVLQPTTYNDATEIAGHLKEKKPVVVNLEKLDKETARKIVDFLSGAVYALRGSIKRLQGDLFVLTPEGVNIMTQAEDNKN